MLHFFFQNFNILIDIDGSESRSPIGSNPCMNPGKTTKSNPVAGKNNREILSEGITIEIPENIRKKNSGKTLRKIP